MERRVHDGDLLSWERWGCDFDRACDRPPRHRRLTMIGLLGSIHHPVGLAWLVRNAENRGQALGLNGLFGSVGVGSASLVAATLTALGGWRMAFIVPGVVCIAVGIALWACVRAGSVVAATHDRKPQ